LKDYTPSPYEKSHVALKKGQLVTVLEMQSMGKWFFTAFLYFVSILILSYFIMTKNKL